MRATSACGKRSRRTCYQSSLTHQRLVVRRLGDAVHGKHVYAPCSMAHLSAYFRNIDDNCSQVRQRSDFVGSYCDIKDVQQYSNDKLSLVIAGMERNDDGLTLSFSMPSRSMLDVTWVLRWVVPCSAQIIPRAEHLSEFAPSLSQPGPLRLAPCEPSPGHVRLEPGNA